MQIKNNIQNEECHGFVYNVGGFDIELEDDDRAKLLMNNDFIAQEFDESNFKNEDELEEFFLIMPFEEFEEYVLNKYDLDFLINNL